MSEPTPEPRREADQQPIGADRPSGDQSENADQAAGHDGSPDLTRRAVIASAGALGLAGAAVAGTATPAAADGPEDGIRPRRRCAAVG